VWKTQYFGKTFVSDDVEGTLPLGYGVTRLYQRKQEKKFISDDVSGTFSLGYGVTKLICISLTLWDFPVGLRCNQTDLHESHGVGHQK